MTEAPIQVAMASNSRYLPWCAVAMLSCLRSTPEQPVRFHLLHEGDLSAHDRSRLATMVESAGGEIAFHGLTSNRLGTLPSKGDALGGRISWSRVVLPELLHDVERIVYLDADTLVTASLGELWRTPLDGRPLAAVRNVVEPAMRGYIRSIGIADFRDYFNAGVLLMDLAAMREENALDAIMRYVAGRGGTLTWFDQDTLNVVFAGRWLALHPRWNAQNSFWTWTPWAEEVFESGQLVDAMRDPAILHFEGPALCKPWHYLSTHPFTQRYRGMLAATPWHDEPLLERTPMTRVIGLLPVDSRISAYLRGQRALAAVARNRARLGRSRALLRRLTGGRVG